MKSESRLFDFRASDFLDGNEPWPLPESKPLADKFDQPQRSLREVFAAMLERVGI